MTHTPSWQRWLLAGLVAGCGWCARAAQPVPPPPDPPAGLVIAEIERPLAYLVELTEPSVAQVYARMRAARPPADRAAAGAAGQRQAQRNREQQRAFLAALRQRTRVPDEAILYGVVRAINGIALRAGSAEPALLRSLPGVKAVHALAPEHLHNAGSVPFIQAPPVWQGIGLPAGYDGTGIRIAVIDTGIDYLHPAFGGTGLVADYQNARTATTNFTTAVGFPTAKVIGGHDFVGDAYDGSNAPVPDANPMDCNGHGSHVAGTAAGFGVNSDGTPYAGPFDTTTPFGSLRIGPGVAPKASLYALRVFGCGGTTAFATAAIDWALDPNGDDDLSDHADVINLSLGSNYGRTNSATALAADNAVAVGAIVVASAGNSGDSPTVVGSPASGRDVIAVANTTAPRTGPTLNVTSPAPIAGLKTTAVAGWNASPALPVSDSIVATNPTNGCTAFVNAAAVAGNFALIDRGGCNFDVKHNNATAAGAVGTIVVNNVPGLPIAMGGTPVSPAVPAVMIGQSAGAQIRNSLLSGPVTATLEINSAIQGDLMNVSSSRGPTGGGGGPWFLKPDIAAPGTSIVSVQTGVTCPTGGGCINPDASTYRAGGQALTLSGTSMASPHAAGVAALIMQAYPTLTPRDVREMLVATAETDVRQEAGGLRHGASRAGGGRIDVVAAMDRAALLRSEPQSMPNGEALGSGSSHLNLLVSNSTLALQNYDVTPATVADMAGVSITAPPFVAVPPGATVTMPVTLSFAASQIKRGRDPTMVLLDVTGDSRPWLTEEDEVIEMTHSGIKSYYRVSWSVRPVGTLASTGVLTTPAVPPPANGSGTIDLSGQGVCTGSLNGLNCTTTPASPSATNPRIDFTGIGYPLGLYAINPVNPAMDPGANLRHVGVSWDGSRFRFGASTHGKRTSSRDQRLRVLVDNNADGTYDVQVLNGFAAVGGSQPSDTPYTAVGPLAGPLSIAGYLNGYPAWQFEQPVYDTDVMLHSVTAAQIGVGGPFRWAMESCDRNDVCETLGPFTTNAAALGTSFGTNAAFFLQDDAAVPVLWNAANIAAENSKGVLLLNFHNASGRRAEHIRFPTATTLGTSAPSVPEGGAVTLTATVAGINIGGAVQFAEGDTVLPGCGAVPLVAGQALCPTPALALGTFQFRARFLGTDLNAPSAGNVVQTVTPVAGTLCRGFGDVDRNHPFCPYVEAMFNRAVTRGCATGLYCPSTVVNRTGMAAFMKNLGGAETPVGQSVEQSVAGSFGTNALPPMCETPDLAPVDYPRAVDVDAVLGLTTDGTRDVRPTLWRSNDGGATWQRVGELDQPATVKAGAWSNQRVSARAEIPSGATPRFSARFGLSNQLAFDAIGGNASPDTVTLQARCRLRVLAFSRDSTHSPFDAIP